MTRHATTLFLVFYLVWSGVLFRHCLPTASKVLLAVPCQICELLTLQAEDAATEMGGQATAAVAAAEAVLQEVAAAVAKQIRKPIPEAQNMFSDEAADPAASPDDLDNIVLPEQDPAQSSADEDSGGQVHSANMSSVLTA